MPRDGAGTRERLLDAAQRLIERQGFAATTVDQILAQSGSSKGAFFHHFESKRALGQSLISRFVDADLALLNAGLRHTDGIDDPAERLLGFLRYYEDWSGDLTAESACLYLPMVTERDTLEADAAAEVERAIVGWRTAVARLIKDAYEASGGVDGPEPDDLADQLFVTFVGAFLVCRALDSPEPMRSQLRVYRELVQAAMAPPGGSGGTTSAAAGLPEAG